MNENDAYFLIYGFWFPEFAELDWSEDEREWMWSKWGNPDSK